MSYLYLFKYKKSHKNSNFKHTGIKNCCFYNASKYNVTFKTKLNDKQKVTKEISIYDKIINCLLIH